MPGMATAKWARDTVEAGEGNGGSVGAWGGRNRRLRLAPAAAVSGQIPAKNSSNGGVVVLDWSERRGE